MLSPLFLFAFFRVGQRRPDVVVAFRRARVSFRSRGPSGEPHVGGRGAARRLTAKQLDGQSLRSDGLMTAGLNSALKLLSAPRSRFSEAKGSSGSSAPGLRSSLNAVEQLISFKASCPNSKYTSDQGWAIRHKYYITTFSEIILIHDFITIQ